MDGHTEFNTWLRQKIGEDRYAKTYAETIEDLQPSAPDFFVEQPHIGSMSRPPHPSLKFLAGTYTDLGFENLEVDRSRKAELSRAFYGRGVGVPGTGLRLRFLGAPFHLVAEPADGSEPELPGSWKSAVMVMKGEDFTWIGKRVRPEQTGNVDLSNFRDAGDGWAA